MHRLMAFCSFISVLTLSGLAAAATPYEYDTSAPVVAIGGVQGAPEELPGLLMELGLIDADLNWSGGDTRLISMGEFVGAGPGSHKTLELLIKLDSQAAADGGDVHVLLSKQAVMMLTGDLGRQSLTEFAPFADKASADARDRLFAAYHRLHADDTAASAREKFDRNYPPGFLAMQTAYSPQGDVGAWLISQPFAVRVNDKLYMHAGVSKSASELGLSELNQRLANELQDYLNSLKTLHKAAVLPVFVPFGQRPAMLKAPLKAADSGGSPALAEALTRVSEAQETLLFKHASPLQYRGTATCHPYSESFNTEQFLNRVGASQMVIGHTPTGGQVQQRMNGLVIRLNSGNADSGEDGRLSALVSDQNGSYVHYPGSRQKAKPVPEKRELSRQLSGMSDSELEDFMRTAPVVHIEEIGTGVTKPKRVTQSRNGMTNDAAFKYEDTNPHMESARRYNAQQFDNSDRYVYDIAAYKLDRMLGLEMVPVAVLSEIEGKHGTLSDWAENTINERDRLEQELPFESDCRQWEQYRLRFVFDILIYNEDRNLTNILWSKDGYMLKFIDQSLAFRSFKKRPKQYRKVSLEVSALLRSRLESLNSENLSSALSSYLHPRQIEAILARRDLILREAVYPYNDRYNETD